MVKCVFSVDYGGKELRELFDGLEGIRNYTLLPLFHVAADEWLKQLPEQSITDLKKLPPPGLFCASTEYHLIVDGKLVEFSIVDSTDSPLSFLGAAGPTKKAAKQFTNFIQNQGLEQLVKKTVKELKLHYRTYFHNCPSEFLNEVLYLYHPKERGKLTKGGYLLHLETVKKLEKERNEKWDKEAREWITKLNEKSLKKHGLPITEYARRFNYKPDV